jgi:hypothetical protein
MACAKGVTSVNDNQYGIISSALKSGGGVVWRHVTA